MKRTTTIGWWINFFFPFFIPSSWKLSYWLKHFTDATQQMVFGFSCGPCSSYFFLEVGLPLTSKAPPSSMPRKRKSTILGYNQERYLPHHQARYTMGTCVLQAPQPGIQTFSCNQCWNFTDQISGSFLARFRWCKYCVLHNEHRLVTTKEYCAQGG